MTKIVLKKTTSAIFLAVVLVAGTFAVISPSFIIGEAQAAPYYGMSSSYDDRKSYGIDDRDKSKDTKSISINKIKCINDNINVNGVNAGNVSIGNKGQGQEYLGANSYGSNGYDNNKKDKGFDCIINNNNTNTNLVSTGGGGNQTVPLPEPEPEPEPEPTTASLTVKKQVFGCDNISPGTPPIMAIMDCDNLENDSPAWLDCNTNPTISGTVFCQSLPESIFDIEVLDDQNSQIQQFEGSEQGTTIQNLEPGTYTVNEIVHLSGGNQLIVNPGVEAVCINPAGFTDGGSLVNTTSNTRYTQICFEYEDEQDNDCSTITLAAGEERTCIVKNYIRFALDN